MQFASPLDAREAGIETVYQNLALSPALSIADNMFLGREIRKPGFMGRWLRALDRPAMEQKAREKLTELGLMTIQNIGQAVETLGRAASGGGGRAGGGLRLEGGHHGRTHGGAGVKESRRVLELILDVKRRGLPIVLISHNMPHVFEVADRVHVHRLGRRLCVIDPRRHSMSDAVALMTGAMAPESLNEFA